MNIRILSFFILPSLLLLSNCSNRTLKKETVQYPFQEKILEYVLEDSIPQNGGYIYYWAPDSKDTTHLGTATNIDYLGTRLSVVRENRGIHCVGISWQVCMTVLQDWTKGQNSNGAILNMSVEDMKEFVDKWFVKLENIEGLASLSVPEEMGSVYALTSYNLGEKIAFENAKAGDFVQYWRKDNTGHSCIFLNWVRDETENIFGFRYWGAQPQTDGIGTDTEYFHPNDHAENPDRLVDKNRFYVGRLAPNVE